MNKKVKTILILLAIVVLVGLVASYLLKSKSTPSPTTTGPLSASSKAAGVPIVAKNPAATSEFSALLSTIKGIDIDTSIFSDPAYLTLRDYPITLGTDTVGRPNPFAPVGYDVGATASDTSQVQFETLQPGKVTATTAEFGAQALLGSANITQTNVVFEYGTNDLFGSSTPPIAMTKNGTVLFTATGLIPGTTYSVRAVLAQGSITKLGNTMTFTTTPTKPR